jgi:hypothetical protein
MQHCGSCLSVGVVQVGLLWTVVYRRVTYLGFTGLLDVQQQIRCLGPWWLWMLVVATSATPPLPVAPCINY